MNGSWRTRAVVVSGLVVALVAVTAAAVFWYQDRQTCCGTATPTTNNAASVDLALSWPTYFYNAFDMTVLLPPGMNVCEDGDSGFTVRNDGCKKEGARPSFTVRRNAVWDAMDATAAFNDAYGQQLKEAGLETIDGRGTLISGKSVSVQRYDFSDSFAGAVVTDTSDAHARVKRVAVDIARDIPLYANDAPQTERIISLFLSRIVLMQPTADIKQPTASERIVFNDATVGYSVNYPSDSTQYEPSSPAALAVSFGGHARLEVRTGATIDSTRGSLEGYRKLTEKEITVNGAAMKEERFVPKDPQGSAHRLLFVSFSKGTKTVGVSFFFSGDPAEEARFETILGTFSFSDS